jgi:hypothetical protein
MAVSLIKLITPINISEEKENFFKSNTYNPVFKYSWDELEIVEYLSKHKSKQSFVRAFINQEPTQITKAASELYAVEIQKEEQTIAQDIIRRGFKNIVDPNLDKVVSDFQKALASINIDYVVEVQDRGGFNIRPNHIQKKIIISSEFQNQFSSLEATIRHEMTHVIRAINHKAQSSFERSVKFLPTEEGLSSFMQDYFGNEPNFSLFQHASEYMACIIGVDGSLRDIFDYFISLGYEKNFAWKRAIRHKFGFIDTKTKGDIMKPGMYFHNEQKIRKLEFSDWIKLFNGKISLDNLNSHVDYTGVVSLEKLKEFYGINQKEEQR